MELPSFFVLQNKSENISIVRLPYCFALAEEHSKELSSS